MPGDSRKKMRSGDRLSADSFNITLDAARVVSERFARTGATPAPAFKQTGIILVRNNSGGVMPRFGVLNLGDPIITPSANLAEFQRQVTFEGDIPATADAGRFVILQEPIADGGIGKAVISGVTIGKVFVTTAQLAAPPDRAEVSDGEINFLDLADDGSAEVLWQETLEEEGEAWAILRLSSDSGGGGSSTFSGARVYRTSNQTITTSGVIEFNNESFDTDTYHDNSTNPSRLTAPATGYYVVGTHFAWSTGTFARTSRFMVNGSSSVYPAVWTTNGTILFSHLMTTMLQLSSGDYIEVEVVETESGTLDISATSTNPAWFWIYRVG